jgi:hypothetical protein
MLIGSVVWRERERLYDVVIVLCRAVFRFRHLVTLSPKFMYYLLILIECTLNSCHCICFYLHVLSIFSTV